MVEFSPESFASVRSAICLIVTGCPSFTFTPAKRFATKFYEKFSKQTKGPVFCPRSGPKHKAWGVARLCERNPRLRVKKDRSPRSGRQHRSTNIGVGSWWSDARFAGSYF